MFSRLNEDASVSLLALHIYFNIIGVIINIITFINIILIFFINNNDNNINNNNNNNEKK